MPVASLLVPCRASKSHCRCRTCLTGRLHCIPLALTRITPLPTIRPTIPRLVASSVFLSPNISEVAMKTVDLLDRRRASCAGLGSRGACVTRTLMLLVLAFAAMVTFCDSSHAGAISSRRLLAFRVEQASIERNTYDSVWYVQDMDGGAAPRRVADGGVPLRDAAGVSLPATATWSPDGRWIYYRALMDGKIDVWRAAADGSGAEPMTLDAADVREFSLSKDRLRLIYSGL